MSIKPDHWIRRMALEHHMIEPFVENQVREGVVSFGLSSYGYDIRVADEFRIFTPATGQLTVVDPKQIDSRAMAPYQGEVCIIPPQQLRPGTHRRVLPHPAQRADNLSRKEYVCKMRYNSKCYSL